MRRPFIPAVRNWRAVAATIVVVWHLGAMLLTNAVKPVRRAVWPVIGPYAEGLRMTNRFGMFARPPEKAVLLVIGERAGGEEIELGTTAGSERTWGARIVDARLRKVQSKLVSPRARTEWGSAYLSWFCRSGATQGVVRVRLEQRTSDELDEQGRVMNRARREVLLERRCDPGQAAS